MSNAALFASGTLITLVFVVGMGLLVWGAILDGRYNKAVHDRMDLDAAGVNGRTRIPEEPALAGRP